MTKKHLSLLLGTKWIMFLRRKENTTTEVNSQVQILYIIHNSIVIIFFSLINPVCFHCFSKILIFTMKFLMLIYLRSISNSLHNRLPNHSEITNQQHLCQHTQLHLFLNHIGRKKAL